MPKKEHKHELTIGILGGMGPAASADFYRRLVDIAQHEHGADQDTDFPAMHLYNLPLSGFDETGFAEPEIVRTQLIDGVRRLEASGSDFIVIPCNTVHAFYADMQAAISVPIVSIIDSVVNAALRGGFSTIGILSSQSTRQYQLYENALAARGMHVLSATEAEQQVLNTIIHRVMAGSQDETDVSALRRIIDRFATEGAAAVVLGCTELPLAIEQKDSPLPLLNSTDILAHTALDRIYE